jgi:hypothetical protein
MLLQPLRVRSAKHVLILPRIDHFNRSAMDANVPDTATLRYAESEHDNKHYTYEIALKLTLAPARVSRYPDEQGSSRVFMSSKI